MILHTNSYWCSMDMRRYDLGDPHNHWCTGQHHSALSHTPNPNKICVDTTLTYGICADTTLAIFSAMAMKATETETSAVEGNTRWML